MIACKGAAAPPQHTAACTTRACVYQGIARTTDLDAFSRASYGPAGVAALKALRTRPGYDALIVDPAIVLAVDEFMRTASGDPWAARARFVASRGTVRVYRAVAVSATIEANIHARGFQAPRLRTGQDAAPTNLVDEAVLHVVAQAGGGDSLISVSSDPAVAKCVAHAFVGDDRRVVLFAIDLPAREVIHLDPGSPVCGPVPAPGSLDCSAMHPPFDPALRPYLCASLYDPAIESFVVNQIDPAELARADTPADFADCDEVMERVGAGFGAKLAAARAACR